MCSNVPIMRQTTRSRTRTRDLLPFHYSWCSVAVRVCHDARPTAHPFAHRPILSMPEHYGSPLNHHLERSKRCRADWRAKCFRCINRWCSEKPKKTPPKLTAFLTVDQVEIYIFCKGHDSKQTQRGFSIVAGVIQ